MVTWRRERVVVRHCEVRRRGLFVVVSTYQSRGLQCGGKIVEDSNWNIERCVVVIICKNKNNNNTSNYLCHNAITQRDTHCSTTVFRTRGSWLGARELGQVSGGIVIVNQQIGRDPFGWL